MTAEFPESQSVGPGTVIAGYRIEKLVSRGGMGVVYSATNVALGQRYALKVLAPELANDERFLERFRREIRLAASLRHPHAVEVHYAGEVNGQPFLIMDFVEGTNLRDLIARDGALEPGRSVRLLVQVTGALDAAHRLGLVHRDIKPANVLVTERDGEEHAYLTDFGLAKRIETHSDLTRTGLVLGTVDYMSPEQITGGHIDARSDVYSLGCVFFQMLTGRVPFERDNTAATMWAQVYDRQPSLSEVRESGDPALDAVLSKAMAKDPEERYLSAGDFGRDAVAAVEGSRFEGRPTVVATGDATPRPKTAETLVPPPAGAGSGSLDEGERQPTPVPEEPLTPTPVEPSAAAPASAAQPVPDPAATADPARPSEGAIPPAGAPPETRSRGIKRRGRLVALLAALLVGAAIAVITIVSSESGSPSPPAGQGFTTGLDPVPRSRVRGAGTASVVVRGNAALVTVNTARLFADTHLMHIHGESIGRCPPESAAKPHHGHRVILSSDGAPFYGQVVTSLTRRGDTSPKSVTDFDRFSEASNIRYVRKIPLGPRVIADLKNGNAVIVVHGIDFNGNHKYDSVLGLRGRRDLNYGKWYNAEYQFAEATAPALCGSLRKQGGGTRAGVERYTATLNTETPALALLCHLAPIGSEDRRRAL